MLKVQNSFNEKNLNKHGINNKNKLNVSFSGHKVFQDDKGEYSYRFYLPPVKEGATVKLELAKFGKDKNGNYSKYLESLDYIQPEKKDNYFNCSFDDLNLQNKKDKKLNEKNKDFVIAYRFKINDQNYLDSTLLTSDMQWNIATPPSRPVLEEARSMYHIMPDLMLSKKTEKENPKIYDARRTHSNKMGGNIDGIVGTDADGNWDGSRLDYMDKLGVKRILSTPIFGQDNISSHGYWTTNPYQITDSLGDISKFKKLNTELFKKGMGWIADGAFVNEGLEGIHLEHISKWGTQSPYIDWLNTFSFPDKPFKFGILPKKEDVNNENLGIRLINADYKLHVDENGKEKWIPNKRDDKKPSYVQIYDKRLASREQINGEKEVDSEGLIRNYHSKNSEDSNKINDYMDSVIPYKFKIKPDEVNQKFKNWEEAKKLTAEEKKEEPKFLNFLAEWTNFAAVSSDSDGGTTLWVGNKDISKLRFMITEEDKKAIKFNYGEKAEEKLKKVENSINQVQDNIVQVGEFWTNEVAKTLQTYTAKELAGATDAKSYAKKLNEKIKSGELPQAALKLIKKNKDGSVESPVIQNLLKGKYNLKTAPAPQNITDGLMSYPLDAIEFNSGMSSILGSPYIKKLASEENQIGKSRYEIFEDQQKSGYKDIPEEFRAVYQETDNLIAGEMKDAAVEILKEVDKKRAEGQKILTANNELTKDGKELYGLISNDMAKFIVTQGLLTEAAKQSPALFKEKKLAPKENTDSLEYDRELLAKVSPQSLGINAVNPKDEAEKVIAKQKSGIKAISESEIKTFAGQLATRLKGLDGNTVKVAKLVVDKAEGGLEWRIDAAKDVCPIEEMVEGKADFESNWDKGIKFWNKFTDGVRKYNPRAYEILEITDEKELTRVNKTPEANKKYKNAHEAMLKFMQESGATTPTNYNFLYSWPHELYGSNTEKSADSAIWKITEKLLYGWDKNTADHCFGFLRSGSQDSVNQSHNSIGNHDKPRALHGFGLDMVVFHKKTDELKGWYCNSSDNVTGKMKFFYTDKPEDKPDFDSDNSTVNGKALAMGIAMKESLENSQEFKKLNDLQRGDIYNALKKLTNGKYGAKGKFDPELFGVRPFDVNIKDVIEEAKKAPETSLALKENAQKLKTIETETLVNMLAPAMKKYRAAMGLLAGMPGNPTIFAGDELGETGFEYKFKNTFVQNRNLNHYNRVGSEPSENIKEIENKKNEIAKLMKLRKDKAFSPLVDGSTVVLDTKKANIVGLYRYNDEKDMIILFTKEGFGMNRNQDGKPTSVTEIELSSELQLNKSANDCYANDESSIISNLQTTGVIYKNALEENDETTYKIIYESGKKLLKKYDKNDNAVDITMQGSDLFLYRTTDFKGNENKPSFSGNSSKKNPHVTLKNMKFNIPR